MLVRFGSYGRFVASTNELYSIISLFGLWPDPDDCPRHRAESGIQPIGSQEIEDSPNHIPPREHRIPVTRILLAPEGPASSPRNENHPIRL